MFFLSLLPAKFLCSGEWFLISLGMGWTNFIIPLKKPQKGCFYCYLSHPHTVGWRQFSRLLKIVFSFANMHLNYSPTEGSKVAWASGLAACGARPYTVCVHHAPACWTQGSTTCCPFIINMWQAFCIKEAGFRLQYALYSCCAPSYIYEKPVMLGCGTDIWTR